MAFHRLSALGRLRGSVVTALTDDRAQSIQCIKVLSAACVFWAMFAMPDAIMGIVKLKLEEEFPDSPLSLITLCAASQYGTSLIGSK